MGIYITQKQKEEWEEIRDMLQDSLNTSEQMGDTIRAGIEHFELQIYRDLLSKAVVLPVHKNWDECSERVYDMGYEQGVIIEK
jgi:hypothetical protein